jgi:putative phosphoesterase
VCMRIAILADIHGNLAALEAAVAELDQLRPDLVVHGGDLAVNGPRPAQCVDLVRERGWRGVVGNTDEALWGLPSELPKNTRRTFQVLAPATAAALGEERIRWLQTLPPECRQGDRLALVHAVPGDTWRGLLPDTPNDVLADTYRPLRAALVVYCHIHRPFIRDLGEFVVANTGSVGLPWDGDTRASYLWIEDGMPEIRRVAYDVERHVAELERSRYPARRWLIEQARTAAGGFVKLD